MIPDTITQLAEIREYFEEAVFGADDSAAVRYNRLVGVLDAAIQQLSAQEAEITRLTAERDSFQRVGITTLARAEHAERALAELNARRERVDP